MSQHFTISKTESSKVTRRVQVTRTIKKTLPDGQVITETQTEYREVTDDSDFGNFGKSATPTSMPETKKIGSSLSPSASAAKKASDSSSSSDEEEESTKDFEEDALKAHNAYRSRHGVQPLKLDKKLCKYAKEWADHLAAHNKFEHRSSHTYGENIFCSWSSNPKAKCPGNRPVDDWYSEVAKYNFERGPGGAMTGHFTQVVWKDSKLLGIAKARSKSGKVIVVANYDPAGNFVGKYQENVFKAR